MQTFKEINQNKVHESKYISVWAVDVELLFTHLWRRIRIKMLFIYMKKVQNTGFDGTDSQRNKSSPHKSAIGQSCLSANNISVKEKTIENKGSNTDSVQFIEPAIFRIA